VAALLVAAGLAAPAAPAPAAAASVEVVAEGGAVLARRPLPEGAEACLRWNHSVTGGPVADCFVVRAGRLVLARSYLHDYAAGLGEVPGRGVVRAASGGGYWIEGMNEALPAGGLPLRVGGPAVAHRLDGPGWRLDLLPLAGRTRVILRAGP